MERFGGKVVLNRSHLGMRSRRRAAAPAGDEPPIGGRALRDRRLRALFPAAPLPPGRVRPASVAGSGRVSCRVNGSPERSPGG
jgi:hypothetical protein